MSVLAIRERLKKRSANELLGELDDYSIYCHFIGEEVMPGQLICSPLRIDRKPTFNIFYPDRPRWEGQLLYKDFNGETGNVFTFIQKYAAIYDCTILDTNQEAILYAQQKMKGSTMAKTNNLETPGHKGKKYNFQKFAQMPPEHLEYWEDIGATKDLLEIYGVVAAEYLLDGETFKIIKSFHRTLTFGYIIGDRFKLYQPDEENFKKFFNTCPRGYYQGYGQCTHNYGEFLLITKAMKDIIVFQAYTDSWIDIIAPHGEGYSTPDNWLEFMLRYKKIIIVFDFDLAGIKGIKRLTGELRSSRFYRGNEIIYRFVGTKRNMKRGKMVCPLKDIADYRLYSGHTKTKLRVNEMLYA